MRQVSVTPVLNCTHNHFYFLFHEHTESRYMVTGGKEPNCAVAFGWQEQCKTNEPRIQKRQLETYESPCTAPPLVLTEEEEQYFSKKKRKSLSGIGSSVKILCSHRCRRRGVLSQWLIMWERRGQRAADSGDHAGQKSSCGLRKAVRCLSYLPSAQGRSGKFRKSTIGKDLSFCFFMSCLIIH